MSLFDDLIGSSSTANSNNKSSQNEVQQQSQTTNSNTAQTGATNTSGTTAQTQKGTSVTSSLDPTTIALIGSLLQPLAAQAANPNAGPAGQLTQIAQQFQQKAATPAVSKEDIAGQQSAAVTSFNSGEAVQNARLVQSLGSNQNTYAALTQQQGQKDLASTLAGITANADVTNSQLSSQNLADAIQALTASSQVGSAGVGNIAALLNVLKGATTSTTSSADDITNALQAILSSTQQNVASDQETNAGASSTSASTTAGSQGSGLLGLLF